MIDGDPIRGFAAVERARQVSNGVDDLHAVRMTVEQAKCLANTIRRSAMAAAGVGVEQHEGRHAFRILNARLRRGRVGAFADNAGWATALPSPTLCRFTFAGSIA